MKHIGSNITATSRADYESHALGRHTWSISGDTCKTGQKSYLADLKKLTLCWEAEFTCRDGDCVTMDRRCDQIPNCKDGSDEIGCQTVIFKDGCRKDIPPTQPIINLRNPRDLLFPSLSNAPIVSNISKALIPLDLEIEISNVKVVSMQMEEEVQHYITFQCKITLTWKDQRVKFPQSKAQQKSQCSEQQWNKPDMTAPLFLRQHRWQGHNPTGLTLEREGNFTRSGFDQVDEDEIFAGSENSLRMKQVYKRKFQCQYVLDRYCSIVTYMQTLWLFQCLSPCLIKIHVYNTEQT